ncbi:MAG: type II secretion system protein J, partial [Planctomyces sp.]
MSSKHTHSPCERRAFTLMELTIALVSVALLAVGIAQIFRATGQTVSQGKRLSTLTSTAAALERQLASALASMTRDGVRVN